MPLMVHIIGGSMAAVFCSCCCAGLVWGGGSITNFIWSSSIYNSVCGLASLVSGWLVLGVAFAARPIECMVFVAQVMSNRSRYSFPTINIFRSSAFRPRGYALSNG